MVTAEKRNNCFFGGGGVGAVGCMGLVAFHPWPQMTSELGRNFTRSSNPQLKSQVIPKRYEIFGFWPQIHIATGLNSPRLENCNPNLDQNTVIFENITFLIQKHFKTVTVTVVLGNLIQMTFKTVIGNQRK